METRTEAEIKRDGSLSWVAEFRPDYCANIADLYSWSSNFTGFAPYAKFLDLIGYSWEKFGSPLQDWSNPAKDLGYFELGKLAESLAEFIKRPIDVENFISEIAEIERDFGL